MPVRMLMNTWNSSPRQGVYIKNHKTVIIK